MATSSSHEQGLHLRPFKFANMDEWFVTSYESLMEQVSHGEGLDNLRDSSEQQRDYSEQHHRSRHSNNNSSSSSSQQLQLSEDEIKSAIIGHPQYRELVTAHMNCHKVRALQVGAPAHLVAEMDELIRKHQDFQPAVTTSIGANPELDQFMVAYCNVLNSYESELKRTFKDAVEFCNKLEQQLNLISNGSIDALGSAALEGVDDDIEEEEADSADVDVDVDPLAGDKELKRMLMLKYGAFIRGLTQEYLKKKKKGKLPKESRQKLLDWWSQHQDHPYPSEAQKASLARSTGLDPKQINNWFINQRKRHWNPGAARGEPSSSQQQHQEEGGDGEAK